MSSTAISSDKELGALINTPTETFAISKSEDEPRPSFRQVLFILIVLWTAWLIGITFDTLLEVDNRAWNRGPMSPLQRYVYTHEWDLWVYNHDYFNILSPINMNKIVVTCMTLCVILIIGRTKTLPSKDAITASFINGLVAACVLYAAWMGANEKEAGLIAMPCGWLLGTSASVFLNRVCIEDLDDRFGVSEKVGIWCHSASLACVVAVHMLSFGFGNDMFLLFVLMQGIKIVYGKLG